MSKNLYQFAALTGEHAREALRIVEAHPEVCDTSAAVRFLAAFERGDDVQFDDGPVDELQAVVSAAAHAYPANELAFYRAVLDGWNRTAMRLHPWVARRWPNHEHVWITFLATGGAILSREHRDWLAFAPRPTRDEIEAALHLVQPAGDAGRAFLTALFDWTHWCQETKCVGVITSRTLGPSLADDELTY